MESSRNSQDQHYKTLDLAKVRIEGVSQRIIIIHCQHLIAFIKEKLQKILLMRTVSNH